MKRKISVSLAEETIEELDQFLKDGTFRNKSHFVEVAVNKFMREVQK